MKNYIAALLADITYLNLDTTNFVNGKLTAAGAASRKISTEEMNFFNNNFTVINQTVGNPLEKGFSAMVIKADNQILLNGQVIMEAQETSIAYRGTEPTQEDLTTDLQLALAAAVTLGTIIKSSIDKLVAGELVNFNDVLSKISEFNNGDFFNHFTSQRNAAVDFFNQTVANDLLINGQANKINIYGHSLGGYLSNYVTTHGNNYTQIKDTITFNAPGFNAGELYLSPLIVALRSLKENTPDITIKNNIQQSIDEISNLYQDEFVNQNALPTLHSIYSTTGLEFTANDSLGLFHPENRYPTYTDDAGVVDNHYVSYLRESMCVYDTLSCIISNSNSTPDNYKFLSEIINSYNHELILNNTTNRINQSIKDISAFFGLNITSGINLLSYVSSLSLPQIQSYNFEKTLNSNIQSMNESYGSAVIYSLLNFVPFVVYTNSNNFNNNLYNINSYSQSYINDRFNLFEKIINISNESYIDKSTSTLKEILAFDNYKIIYSKADFSDLNSDYIYIDEFNKLIFTNSQQAYSEITSNMMFGLNNSHLKTIYFKNSSSSLIVNTLNNIIHDYFGDDNIALNKGSTDLDLSYGNDTVMIDVAGGASIGNLTIKDGGLGDLFIFNGSNLNDVIYGTQYNDKIIGGDDNDILFGHAGNDTLLGGNGNDILIGGAGSDILDGGDGDDQLNNEDTNLDYSNIYGDTLIGGKGINQLYGTGYGDRYIYNLGDGVNTIYEKDFHVGVSYIDSLNFGLDILPNQISFMRNLFELVISINNINKIFVVDYFYHYEFLDEIHFSDSNNTVWKTNDILNQLPVDPYTKYGTSGNDTITGTSGNDTLYGGDGDDTINGGVGNDFIFGGNGNDTLNGDAGNDTIYGEAGNDIINGGVGIDTLYGGDGNDIIVGGSTTANEQDTIFGGSGNDIINRSQSYTGDIVWGGLGDDEIYGSAGSDSYHYTLGDGHDKISENNSTASFIDQLYLHNLTPDDIKIYRKGINLTDVFIDIKNGQGSIILVNYYVNVNTLNFLDKIIFDNGTIWNQSDIATLAKNYYGTDSNDTLIIDNVLDNNINTGNGDDRITIRSDGITNVKSGAGNDTIIIDSYKSGSTNPMLGEIFGDAGDDIIRFEQYNTQRASYTISGGLGNDNIYMSQNGTETIRYRLGDGKDIINVRGSNISIETDKVIFENISKNQFNNASIELRNRGNDLVFKLSDGGEVTFVSYIYQGNINNIKTFEFSDGSLTNIEIKDLFTKINKAETDGIFYDTNFDDTITGTENNDTINVNYGSDIVNSGDGDDKITIKAVGNTIVNAGNGNDIIFVDTELYQATSKLTGIIYGGGGDDTISFSSKNSNRAIYTINGGSGDDKIVMSNDGTETIVYKLGDGKDTIHVRGNNTISEADKVVFENISKSQFNNASIELRNRGNDLVFKLSDGGEITFIGYIYQGNINNIKTFEFSDGILTSNEIKDLISKINKAEADGIFYDTHFDDVITGTENNDTININYGSDTVNAGDGDDKITIKAVGNTIVNAGNGNDIIFVDTELYQATSKLTGTIYGDDGDDNIYFSSYNSNRAIYTINGGKGNDKITMSADGIETIIYKLGDGKDTIYVKGNKTISETDKVIFENISKSQFNNASIELRNKGNDLVFKLSDGGEVTFVGYIYQGNINNIKTFEFSDGSLTNIEIKDLFTKITKAETDGIFYDTNFDDTITGTEINDIININYGSDTVNSGDGDDKITIKAVGNTIVNAGNGNDTIFIDTERYQATSKLTGTIYGDDGDDIIYFSDYNSNRAIFTISGGKGNDRITMSTDGTETIIYKLGDGKDIINVKGNNFSNQTDKIVFSGLLKEDIKNTMIEFRNLGNDVVFKFIDGGEIVLKNYINNKNSLNNIKTFEFDNGILTNIEIKDIVTKINGTVSDDIIYSTAWEDEIRLISGNDSVYLNTGNDILYTGTGSTDVSITSANNIIYSGISNDHFKFSNYTNTLNLSKNNNGADIISKNSTTSNLVLNVNIDASFEEINVSDMKNGYITLSWGVNSSVLLNTSFNGFNIISSNYSTNNLNDFKYKISGDNADNILKAITNDNVTIYGNGGNDTITGGLGNDILYGGLGNDTLTGQAGNDLIYGDDGDDYLIGGQNDYDTLYGGYGNDKYSVGNNNSVIDYYGYNSIYIQGVYSSAKLKKTDSGIIISSSDNKINVSYVGELYKIEVSKGSNTPGLNSLTGNEINQMFDLMAQYDSTDDTSIRSNLSNQMNQLWNYEP